MFNSAPYLALVAACLASAEPARELTEIRRGARLEMAGAANEPALEVGTALGARQSVAFAVRHADATLLSALNAHLGQLRASPSWRLIIVRNLGEDSIQILARSRLDDGR
jgi:hypothetical protein